MKYPQLDLFIPMSFWNAIGYQGNALVVAVTFTQIEGIYNDGCLAGDTQVEPFLDLFIHYEPNYKQLISNFTSLADSYLVVDRQEMTALLVPSDEILDVLKSQHYQPKEVGMMTPNDLIPNHHPINRGYHCKPKTYLNEAEANSAHNQQCLIGLANLAIALR